MAEYPEVAVVILNWNGRKHLETYLPSVLQTEYADWKLYVVDNNSTDDSVAFLQANYADTVEIIQTNENLGYAGGYNAGLKKIAARYYVLLNSDVEVSTNWLDRPIALMKENADVAGVQPKIMSWLDKSSFEYAGAAGGYIDRWGYPFCAGRVFQELEADLGQYDYEKEVFWVSGACMFVKADVFWKVGALDADYFAHMEEIDLCWRLQNAGYRLLQTHQSVVYHLGGGSLAYGNPRKTFLNFRNSLITLQKNLTVFQVIIVVFSRMVLDFPAAMKFLLSGSKADFQAVLDAHLDFYRQFRKNWEKRKLIPKKRLRGSFKVIYQGSIVFDYFVLGRKRVPGFVSTNHFKAEKA